MNDTTIRSVSTYNPLECIAALRDEYEALTGERMPIRRAKALYDALVDVQQVRVILEHRETVGQVFETQTGGSK